MHLEGKSHTGYLKIRNKLAELKQMRRNSDFRGNSPNRSRMSRRPPPQEQSKEDDIYDQKMIFSSRKFGSG